MSRFVMHCPRRPHVAVLDTRHITLHLDTDPWVEWPCCLTDVKVSKPADERLVRLLTAWGAEVAT